MRGPGWYNYYPLALSLLFFKDSLRDIERRIGFKSILRFNLIVCVRKIRAERDRGK